MVDLGPGDPDIVAAHQRNMRRFSEKLAVLIPDGLRPTRYHLHGRLPSVPFHLFVALILDSLRYVLGIETQRCYVFLLGLHFLRAYLIDLFQEVHFLQLEELQLFFLLLSDGQCLFLVALAILID